MNSSLKLLVNPFERIAGYTALGLGLLIATGAMISAYFFNTRFDGILDIHYVHHIKWFTVLVDQLVNILSLSLVFYIAGLLLKGNSFRFIDLCGTVLFARFPFIIAPLLNAGNHITRIVPQTTIQTTDTFSLLFFIFFTIVIMVLIVWYITLLYNAYKVSTNIKGWKVVVSFIVAILLTEALSKFLLYIIFTSTK